MVTEAACSRVLLADHDLAKALVDKLYTTAACITELGENVSQFDWGKII
jgi:hypothetical protein